jgi:hypothetical protein
MVPGKLRGAEPAPPATIIVVAPCVATQEGRFWGRSHEGLMKSSQGAAMKFCYDCAMQSMLRRAPHLHGAGPCHRSKSATRPSSSGQFLMSSHEGTPAI